MPASTKSIAQLAVISTAVAAAAVLPRAPGLQRFHAQHVYPALQAHVTGWSNGVAWPLFDGTLLVLMTVIVVRWFVSLSAARRRRSLRPIGPAIATTATVMAVAYLWFLMGWGLNYTRPPVEALMAYDAARVSPAAVRALADQSVREANRTYAAAHAAGFPAIDAVPPALGDAVQDVARGLGQAGPMVLARPKHSILSPYFRAAGVSGMLAPFWLETLLNPDLTGPERPAVLGHEWAHLAGFAPESDASFVGLLAALRADPPSQYSAWLDLVSESVNQLDPATRQVVLAKLDAGPRADLQAIVQRLRALVQPVEHVAWAAYDRALKSQGVADGVRSYSRVVQLLLGTNAIGTQP